MRPIVYYGNLLTQPGSLTSENDVTNGLADLKFVIDNSLVKEARITADFLGLFQVGAINMLLDEADFCNAIVFPQCRLTVGAEVLVESAFADETGDEILSQVAYPDPTTTVVVQLVSGGVDPLPRRRWLLGTVNLTFFGPAQFAKEMILAKRLVLPRSPEVGVTRDRVRQFKRIDVPNGQAFVKKLGPKLRRTSYNFVVTSGAERDSVNAFVDATDGGQPFYFQDDLGDTYWAEVPEPVVTTSDEAGIDNMKITFQEIRESEPVEVA